MSDKIHLVLMREEPEFAEIKVFVDTDGLPQIIEDASVKNKRVSVCIKDVLIHPKNICKTLVKGCMKENIALEPKTSSLKDDLLVSGGMCVKEEVKQLENETEKEKINVPDSCSTENILVPNPVTVKEEISDNLVEVFHVSEEKPCIKDESFKEDDMLVNSSPVEEVHIKEESHMTEEISCNPSVLCEVWEDLYAKHEIIDEVVLGPEEFYRPKAIVYDLAHPVSTLKEYPGKRKGLKVYPGKRNTPTVGSRKEPPRYIETETLFSSVCISRVVDNLVAHFICDICRKGFKWKHDLLKHIKGHTGEKPSKRNICGNKRKKPETSYVCEKCNEVFQFKKCLTVHRRVHAREKPLQCELCSKGFSSKRSLGVHLQNIHKIKIIHVKRETDTCNICSESYVNINGQNNANGNKPYCCEVCKMHFWTKRIFIEHKRTHTLLGPVKQVPCGLCDLFFATEASAKVHKLTHSADKPYECDM